MNWNRFSTSTKLITSFGLMAVMIAFAGWQGINGLSKLNQEMHTLYTVHALGLAGIKGAETDLHQTVFETNRVVLMNDSAQIAARAEEIKQRQASFERLLVEFQNRAVTTADRQKASDCLNAFQAVSSDQDGILNAALAHKPAEIRRLLAEVQPKVKQLIEALALLEARKLETMNAAASKAEATYISIRTVLFTVIALSVSMAFGFGFFLARLITKPLKQTVGVLQAVAQGDFTRRLEFDSDDELGQMAKALNAAISGIRNALGEVTEASNQVADAARELARASDGLAHGVQDQAASLEESAASLEELTSTVRQNSDNAKQARRQAEHARDHAENGGRVVTEAVSAMSEINLASKRIADIITTIDEIAFQTNLLALNAAVEAARAGEQGRGFAVVASEVRNLAQRSATAAREIKSLIHDSLAKVSNGSELVNRSGKTLNEIVQSVKQVTDIVGEIAAASEEQAVGIDQVNRAVVQMDRVTQANATNTEELTATAQTLSDSAQYVRGLVNRFKLVETQAHKGGGKIPAASGNRPGGQQFGANDVSPSEEPAYVEFQ